MTTNDNTNKKEPFFGLNIGSSSILLIFLILCLVSFAALSIVSANADSKLSRKVLERTTAYYEACNEAEKTLVDIDRTLINIYQNSADAEEYFSTVGHSKSYTIPISNLQSLQVNIEIQYPESDDDTFYKITSWQVLNTGEITE